MKDFFIENDGLRLDGTVIYPVEYASRKKYPTILFIPGWTSERSRSLQYARALVTAGYICVLADLRGHGTSEGDLEKFSSKDFLSDVIAFYDYVEKIEGVDRERISAVGSSFGGYLVAILSDKRRLENLVLRAPADYANIDFEIARGVSFSDRNDEDILKWRAEQRESGESFATEALNKFAGKILIIESEKDDRIPHQTILNYANSVKDKSNLTHKVVSGAPHSIKDGPFKDKVEQILLEWFKIA